MPDEYTHKRAAYDQDGNLVIGADGEEPKEQMYQEVPVEREEEIFAPAKPTKTILSSTKDVLHEGVRQYSTSIGDARETLRKTRESTGEKLRRLWTFLRQPVYVPRKKKPAKEYNRFTLFVSDVVRFGVTFVLIFGVLFVGLNYQSYWQIIRSQLDPIDAQIGQLSLDQAASSVQQQALLESTLEERRAGNLLSFLPPVGPPENYLFVPKLNMTVPIVTTPLDALRDKDWKKLEEEIQEGLKHGTVHYPGTAHPGQAGNFFVTGHSSNYPWIESDFNSVFARLPELSVGDEYWVYYGGDKHHYVIRSKQEVKPTEVSVLDQPNDRRISTLMTCTPVGTTLRRLILTSDEVDPITKEALAVGEQHMRDGEEQINIDVLPI